MNSVLLFVEYKNKILSLLFGESRLKKIGVHENNNTELGAVYIGKVKNVVPSIDACFVEYQKDCIGFLPLKQIKNAVFVKRNVKDKVVSGDEIVVQIETEKIKSKAPGLTCNLSLRGSYSVLTTGNTKIGFSSKLKESKKIQLKDWVYQSPVLSQIKENKIGLVVRTNAAKLEDKEALTEELSNLLEEIKRILQTAKHRTCFSCLYQPKASYLTEIRDLYQWEFEKIITDIPAVYEILKLDSLHQNKLEFYQDKLISLSRLYSVSTRIKEALEERVWLKSGAYLVIQPTEALTVIDVNSGKIQKKHPGDEIYYTINREAAKEIAFQLKLRNISGIIVIDFINQNEEEQDRELLKYFSSLVKTDSVQTNVVGMTALGLVEVTRKKVQRSLREQLEV